MKKKSEIFRKALPNSSADLVENFDPAFFRPCIFPILADLGYGTTVSINNGLVDGAHVTEMEVHFTFIAESGKILGQIDCGLLSPGEVRRIDTRELLEQLGIPKKGTMLGIAHLIPISYSKRSSVTISRDAQMAHVGTSDDFIEFRQEPKGVITGVAYQMGPQNDFRFNRTRTTLIQAPKVVVSSKVDTMFALINASTSFKYEDSADLDFWLINANGSKVARGTIQIPAWAVRFISVHALLKENELFDEFIQQGGLGMIVGLSRNSGLVPISMTRNFETGAIACDHTLPPIYYFSTWGGAKRIEANETLYRNLFE